MNLSIRAGLLLAASVGCSTPVQVSHGDASQGAGVGLADGAVATDRAVDSPMASDVRKPPTDQMEASRDVREPDRFVLPTSEVMAFPGAEGFGADTPGGRGGRIVEVTNLDDTGPGSFREAVRASGPRIVVFRVSGTIAMGSDIEIGGETRSYLSIAGQASPGGIQLKGPKPGITLMDGVHDVVIRHLRVRPGGTDDGSYVTNAGIAVYTGATNVVVDHSSVMWQNHKQIIVWHAAAKATFQWNIIAEGSNSGANKSDIESGPGFIQGLGPDGGEGQTSFHHNLVAHLEFSLGAYGQRVFDARNNVIFDYAGEAGGLGAPQTYYPGDTKTNFINNQCIAGPRSHGLLFYMIGSDAGHPKLFADGNWGPNCKTGCADDWMNGYGDGVSPVSTYKALTAFSVAPVATQPTRDVKDTVLFYAGANKPRDAVDARIVADVVNNRVGFDPNKQGRGPWPDLTGPTAPPDQDHDGMPDAWETAHGLNPKDPSDGPMVAKNHYTNVENYLNELAGDPVP